jgi:predicted nuclease of predicted toxin-antitoxin system
MLSVEYPESRHVTEVGLDTATDAEIWSYAGEHDFVIVSKDSDFRQLAFLHGPPPKAIWVRLGNATTIEIFDALRDNREEIARFGSDADEALLVLP